MIDKKRANEMAKARREAAKQYDLRGKVKLWDVAHLARFKDLPLNSPFFVGFASSTDGSPNISVTDESATKWFLCGLPDRAIVEDGDVVKLRHLWKTDELGKKLGRQEQNALCEVRGKEVPKQYLYLEDPNQFVLYVSERDLQRSNEAWFSNPEERAKELEAIEKLERSRAERKAMLARWKERGRLYSPWANDSMTSDAKKLGLTAELMEKVIGLVYASGLTCDEVVEEFNKAGVDLDIFRQVRAEVSEAFSEAYRNSSF
jgi:hypothetical protein